MQVIGMRSVRVWDLPTRLFHWLFAAGAVAMVVTGKMSGDALIWHARIGYCMGTLLLFRVCWGVVGGHWSRFTNFRPSPRAAWSYLREAKGSAATPGHNPLGALSVYAMLLFFAAQVASGLFSATKEDFAGPLYALVSNATSRWLTGYHKNVGEWILIALMALHLAAIAAYASRGRNLVTPMLTGDAPLAGATAPSVDDASVRLRALVVMVVCSLLMWAIVRLGG